MSQAGCHGPDRRRRHPSRRRPGHRRRRRPRPRGPRPRRSLYRQRPLFPPPLELPPVLPGELPPVLADIPPAAPPLPMSPPLPLAGMVAPAAPAEPDSPAVADPPVPPAEGLPPHADSKPTSSAAVAPDSPSGITLIRESRIWFVPQEGRRLPKSVRLFSCATFSDGAPFVGVISSARGALLVGFIVFAACGGIEIRRAGRRRRRYGWSVHG